MTINKDKTKDNTEKPKSARKSLPQSNIVSKRKEIFNLNGIKKNTQEN